jgi:hypothetical protein
MKKTAIFIVGLSLTLTLLTATPARAHHPHWVGPGFSVGVVVDPFFYSPRYYYPAPPPAYYSPPPPPCPESYSERWIPGYWEKQYDPYYGHMRRFWVPGHWE